uniref:Uncharacterized protein n=1 Tax=Saccharum hybrid cultivar R570 TaxID=131158 RepID=A0A059PZT1_9POAL|nr:hypothetical protein SHCRBa_107_M24_F_90 [Saccharum hybrid cultivar R570]
MADSVSTRHNLDTAGAGAGSRSPSSSTLCLHKVSTQAVDGVLPLKDGSGRLICWNRNGKIWLADVAGTTTGSAVLRVGDKPLIDLGSRVSQDAAARGRGLAGVAVHSSGSLFVSYYTTDGSAFLVLDQLSSASLNGGHDEILFRPTTTDPFLYLVTGPAQRDGQLQAKILRFRVGQDMPSGNGTVTPVEAQVYAAGRRCAFDADRPQDLYCAIVKGEQELVYLTSESSSATPPSQSLLVAHHRPTPGMPPSLVGGLLYRGYADSNLTGSYIYMDGSEFWVTVPSASASPAGNHSATRNLRVTCSASATSPCRGGDFAGGVTSFGEDADKNALLLATDGVYLVVGPSLCDADTQAPTSIKKLLKWIFGVIGTLIATLTGGHVVYRKCSCFNSKNDININAPNGNVNIFNGTSTSTPPTVTSTSSTAAMASNSGGS